MKTFQQYKEEFDYLTQKPEHWGWQRTTPDMNSFIHQRKKSFGKSATYEHPEHFGHLLSISHKTGGWEHRIHGEEGYYGGSDAANSWVSHLEAFHKARNPETWKGALK